MNKIKRALLYAGLDKAEFDALKPMATAENGRYLCAYTSALACIFAGLLLLTAILGGFFAENRAVYLAMALLNCGLYPLARLSRRRPGLVWPLVMCFMAALYTFSFLVTLEHPDAVAVTPVAVILAMPYFFNYRPAVMALLTAGAAALFCGLSARVKVPTLAAADAWNVLTFGGIAVIASVMQARMKYHMMRETRQNRYLSETDVLTGVRNRNAYERDRSACAATCREGIACAFVDVNGLHEMNNQHGHDAGDAMLRAIADALSQRFSPTRTYRIGGDEFVVLCPDETPEAIRHKTQDAEAEIAGQGYSAAFGTAWGKAGTIDVTALVREAEQAMYRQKALYYSHADHDRRRGVRNRQ